MQAEGQARLVDHESRADPAAGSADVPRVRNLADHDFVRHYLNPRVPVVLSDAISSWPALSKWSPRFFKEKYGATTVWISSRKYTEEGSSSDERRSYLLGDVIDLIEGSSPGRPAPYLKNQPLMRLIPELHKDIQPLPACFFPNWIEGPLSGRLRRRLDYDGPELHIGGPGTKFPSLHFDYCYVHTFLAQIYGEKTVVFFSPNQTPLLYPEPVFHHGSLIPDIDQVDLERFPLFASAVPSAVNVRPGELLFIPAGWWHTTRMPGTSITLTFEHANRSNWNDLIRECRHQAPFLAALKLTVYLKLLEGFRSLLGH
jgi:hypothetical protein